MVFLTLRAIKTGIKEAGLRWNHYYFKELEQIGLISPPENTVKAHDADNGPFSADMKIYTPDEVAVIVKTYVDYVKKYKGGAEVGA